MPEKKPDNTWVISFHPEPVETMRRRYKRALRHLFDCRTSRPRPQPHELFSCLFDWPDGLRLIVARKLTLNGVYLSFSAMAYPGSELEKQIATAAERGPASPDTNLLYRGARVAFVDISGDDGPFEFMGFNQRDMPHWKRLLEHPPS